MAVTHRYEFTGVSPEPEDLGGPDLTLAGFASSAGFKGGFAQEGTSAASRAFVSDHSWSIYHPGANDFAWRAMIKIDAVDTQRRGIVTDWEDIGGNNRGWGLFVEKDGAASHENELYLTTSETGAAVYAASYGPNIVGAGWKHLTMVRDGLLLLGYVEASLVMSCACPATLYAGSTFAYVLGSGGFPWGRDGGLHCHIDKMQVWNTALTPVEVSADYVGLLGASPSTPFAWSFTTADGTAPTIANWSPTGTNIPVDQDIVFEVTDTGSGVDLTTLDVTIHGTPAVVNGVPQPGYSLATSPIVDGHEVTVGHPDLDPLEIINVAVDVEDVSGNPASQGWSYTTADTVAPVVTIITPTDLETGVSVLKDIVFEITDVGAGVDLANTTVRVGGILAYDGGAGGFQTDYQGPNSAVAVIAGGYRITIDAEDPYPGLTWLTVRVESQDLQAPPNPMTPVEWSFETEFVDLNAPILSLEDPFPGQTNVAVDATLGFRLTDVSGLDESSVNLIVDGIQALVNGAAGTGYTLIKTPVVDGFDYLVTPDDVLLLDEEYELVVTAADIEGNSGTWDWTFTTVQGVIESPRLYARAVGETINCIWTLPPADEMRQTLFELRRSLDTYPLTPADGELVYSGLDRQYLDTDVVYDQTYFYTIFVVRKYVDGDPVYVAYESQASDRARPRQISVQARKEVEYVPARGDFGARTVNPLPSGQVIATWGQRTAAGARQSDLIRTVAGRPVQSPIRGRVLAVADSEIENADTRLKRVEISAQSGITLSLDGIVPWPDIAAGTDVEAGQTLGRTSAGNVEFRIWKQPTGGFGRRAVRPRYFYLTTESRDGRL